MTVKQSRFQALVEWILDNLFDVATIVVAVWLVIRYQVRPPAPTDVAEIATWILGVLALLAVSGLWERNRRLHRIEHLAEESRNLALRSLDRKAYAGDFFLRERRLTPNDLSSANTIHLAGRVLAGSARKFMHVLGQRLVAGATIRFLILDPEHEPVLQQAVLQSLDAPIGFWRDTLKTTVTIIEALAKTPGRKGTVEIGYLSFIPSFGLELVDPDQQHGTCFVELYQHRSTKPHATFELRASDDPYWFQYFEEQFHLLWEQCRVVTFTPGEDTTGSQKSL